MALDVILFNGAAGIYQLVGQIVYPVDIQHEKINQFSMRTLAGDDVTYSTGKNIGKTTLNIRNVSFTNGYGFRDYIREDMIFQLNKFTIRCATVDLGKGVNVTISDCNFTKDNTKGIFKYEAPGVFTIKFPFRWVR